jgi:hypothetical protein
MDKHVRRDERRPAEHTDHHDDLPTWRRTSPRANP